MQWFWIIPLEGFDFEEINVQFVWVLFDEQQFESFIEEDSGIVEDFDMELDVNL